MSLWSLERYVPSFLLHSDTYYVVLTDLDGLYQVANTRFYSRFRFDPNRIKGVHSFALIHPEDHAACANAVTQCLEYPNQPCQVLLRKPDESSFFWSSWEFSALFDADECIGILCVGHDVTEAQLSSVRVLEYAKTVERILEEMTDGFVQLDENWNFLKINRSASQILGIQSSDFLQKCFWDVVPNQADFLFLNKFKEAVDTKQRMEFDEYFPLADRWFSFLVHPTQEGLSIFFQETSEEIKQRKVILDSQQKLQALLDSTQDSNVYFDQNFSVLTVNERARQESFLILGKSIQLNDDLRDFLEPSFRDKFIDVSMQALQGQLVEMDVTVGGIWFNFRFYPVKNEIGMITGVALNARNIDQNKRAGIRIQEQESLLRAIYNSTTESNTFLDREFVIRFNNQTSREITKQVIGREAKVGEKSLDFILPEDRAEFSDYYTRVLAGERIIVEKIGGNSWWKFFLNPVFDEHNVEIIGISQIVQDISEMKSREAKILSQNQILREIGWRQSHELRRPVATILGILELVKQDKTEMTPALIEYCDFLVAAAKDLDQMTASIVAQVNEDK